MCWIPSAGGGERCAPPTRLPAEQPLAWFDENRVLLEMRNGDSLILARVDLRDWKVEELDRRPGSRSASRDGRWIACKGCEGVGLDDPVILYPVDRPEQWRPLVSAGGVRRLNRLIWPHRAAIAAIAQVTITAVPDTFALDAVARAVAHAVDVNALPTGIGALEWSSSRPSVLAIDSTGRMTPRTSGQAFIVAGAGGWRHDSVQVVVVPPRSTLVLREPWDATWTSRFVPYGSPAGQVVELPHRGRFFWNAGDGNYASGAVARHTWPARAGLGVEAIVSLPTTMTQWQNIAFVFAPIFGDGAISATTLSDSVFVAEHSAGVCFGALPAGEGPFNANRVNVSANAIPQTATVDSGVFSGRPVRMRVQLFPDGRCGVALDGRAIVISTGRTPVDVRMRFYVGGQSVKTRILVGPLEVWTGVRGGVDWSTSWNESRIGKAVRLAPRASAPQFRRRSR